MFPIERFARLDSTGPSSHLRVCNILHVKKSLLEFGMLILFPCDFIFYRRETKTLNKNEGISIDCT